MCLMKHKNISKYSDAARHLCIYCFTSLLWIIIYPFFWVLLISLETAVDLRCPSLSSYSSVWFRYCDLANLATLMAKAPGHQNFWLFWWESHLWWNKPVMSGHEGIMWGGEPQHFILKQHILVRARLFIWNSSCSAFRANSVWACLHFKCSNETCSF